MTERLVVVGGDAAGMTAASQARKRRPSEDLSIVAFDRGNYTSYSACGIPYFVSGVVERVDDLVVRGPDEFREKQDIDVRIRHEVTAIDLESRTVSVTDLESGRELTEGFDILMVGTGAVPIRPPLEGVDADGVFGLQTLDHGVAVKEAVDAGAKRAVVVGGGYIGLEMAEAFQSLGIETTLVEMAPQPMSTLDPDMGALVADAMREIGIEVIVDEGVKGFDTDGGRVSAVVTEGRTLPTDLVVLGIGVRPNVELAAEAGLVLGPSGGIAVDRRMRTSANGVWAAGDCTEKFHVVSRLPVAIPLGTHANKESRVAGINIGGGYATFPGVCGTAVVKVCENEVARTGLNELQAVEAGFETLSAIVESTTRAHYFPGKAAIKTKLVVERESGRLLGAQIVGQEGAAKRIDVLATALWNEMTVEEMLNMDLSYAPPFSPVWDPVLIAARKAWDLVEENR